jgi:putative ABC transport system permease protein
VATKDTPADSSFDGSPSARGRFARWLASWRVALRIARRDARRYKWRSALIVAMVGLPVLFLTSGITLLATNDISTAESVPMVMGSAQARIHGEGWGHRVSQSPDNNSVAVASSDTTALAVPGFALDSGWMTGKVQRLTGGKVIETLDSYVRVTQGDRRPSVPVLGIDARDPMARGMAELASGRWAATPFEIVVTEAGIAAGLPREGTLTAGPDGKHRQLRIVGVATGQTQSGKPFAVASPDLVRAVSDPGRTSAAFLVGRADPVTWPDVRAMNDHGLVVQSRDVFQNPPSTASDPQAAQSSGSNLGQLDLVLLLAAVGLFIETTLMAGPAFAVSAARQRRALALAASNGAEARQLRRYVLGQAVLLGVASAAVAVVAGVLLALAAFTWWTDRRPDFVAGPFEVSWPRVAGVFVCSVVASTVAALLPARGTARLDIVSVLAGRSGDRRAHRGLPVAGVIVMVCSGVATILSAASTSDASGVKGSSMFLVVLGAVGLVIGCLMVIPALLSLAGRLGAPFVLPLRMAARDTARQRGRSTPAVAAIMAAVAALTALSIGAASDTRQQADHYKPHGPMGSGAIFINSGDERSVRAITHRFAPQLTLHPTGIVTGTAAAANDGSKLSWVSMLPPGCTEAQIVLVPKEGGEFSSCGAPANGNPRLEVRDLSTLPAALTLSASQRAVLEGGGILLASPQLVHDGKVSLVAGSRVRESSGATTEHVITQRTQVPAVMADPKTWSGALILPDTAKRFGWPVRITSFDLTSPTGTISPEVERAVADRLGDGYFMTVERGFHNPYRRILLILFSVAGLLVLIASLIATALSLAESQNDMATLAAVGATRRTRRGIAAAEALVVAACGCLLGVAVGVVPGIAVTWPLTTQVLDDVTSRMVEVPPVIVIPWLSLTGLCVCVPLLAAGLAWIAVRRHPQMTRRMV